MPGSLTPGLGVHGQLCGPLTIQSNNSTGRNFAQVVATYMLFVQLIFSFVSVSIYRHLLSEQLILLLK
jgi:hypothetical protein